MQEMQVWSLGWEDPLEEETATHSSSLAWKIPRTEETSGLWSRGLQRVGHNWATEHSFFLFVCFYFCWALEEKLGNTSASYAPLGRCPLWFSWDSSQSSQSFCFFLELLLLLAGGSLFRSPAVWLLLGRQFLLFWGDPLVFWLFRVLTGSSLGKDFFLLGRLPFFLKHSFFRTPFKCISFKISLRPFNLGHFKTFPCVFPIPFALKIYKL